MSKDDLAVVVQSGKASDGGGGGPRPKHKRRIANYMLDKRLQLRYILVVTLMSAAIAGVLGFMIYQQLDRASAEVRANIAALDDEDMSAEVTAKMAKDDRWLMMKMGAAGVGLAVLLSLYLVVMTHKVAGPLFKVTLYFDKMAAGKLGKVFPLRKGDMLTDFYDGFHQMHDAVRARLTADAAAMQKLVDACKAAGLDKADGIGGELEKLTHHVETRKKALA